MCKVSFRVEGVDVWAVASGHKTIACTGSGYQTTSPNTIATSWLFSAASDRKSHLGSLRPLPYQDQGHMCKALDQSHAKTTCEVLDQSHAKTTCEVLDQSPTKTTCFV